MRQRDDDRAAVGQGHERGAHLQVAGPVQGDDLARTDTGLVEARTPFVDAVREHGIRVHDSVNDEGIPVVEHP